MSLNLIDHGVQSLSDALLHAAGQDVDYRQGDESVGLRAIPGRPLYLEQAEPAGTPGLAHDDLEWSFCQADLIFAGRRGTPRTGDHISRFNALLGETETYEVLPGAGQQCWRRRDPAGVLIAVRTKKVATL